MDDEERLQSYIDKNILNQLSIQVLLCLCRDFHLTTLKTHQKPNIILSKFENKNFSNYHIITDKKICNFFTYVDKNVQYKNGNLFIYNAEILQIQYIIRNKKQICISGDVFYYESRPITNSIFLTRIITNKNKSRIFHDKIPVYVRKPVDKKGILLYKLTKQTISIKLEDMCLEFLLKLKEVIRSHKGKIPILFQEKDKFYIFMKKLFSFKFISFCENKRGKLIPGEILRNKIQMTKRGNFYVYHHKLLL